jgi:hypothetical protein
MVGGCRNLSGRKFFWPGDSGIEILGKGVLYYRSPIIITFYIIIFFTVRSEINNKLS